MDRIFYVIDKHGHLRCSSCGKKYTHKQGRMLFNFDLEHLAVGDSLAVRLNNKKEANNIRCMLRYKRIKTGMHFRTVTDHDIMLIMRSKDDARKE